MSKRTKKNNSYNIDVVNALSEEFEVTTTFVRQAIRKEKHSKTAQNIEKKYHELAKPSIKAVQEFKANPTN